MLVIVRGAGDLATGVIYRLHKSGFRVLALECEKPSAIRREVSFSECMYIGEKEVEGVLARKVENLEEMSECWNKKVIPVIVDENGKVIEDLKPKIVIDAILAKKNLGTNLKMAPVTIALGPGFEAGKDVSLVVETMRGHNLGRVYSKGRALENTGIPGSISGITKERVIYSNSLGIFRGVKKIGSFVKKDEILGYINEKKVFATIDGLLRGIINDGFEIKNKIKIADIDPRLDEYDNCFTISDKARSLGGAVLEAIFSEIVKEGEVNGFKYFGEDKRDN